MYNVISNIENNELIAIGILKEYWSNGYPVIIDMNGQECAYPTNFTTMYEVEKIPENIEPYKYCYTEADGFYENPNWIDPAIEITQTPEYQAGCAHRKYREHSRFGTCREPAAPLAKSPRLHFSRR